MIYDVKKIEFNGQQRNIITQNQSGPCALIAIVNVLSLSKKIDLRTYCISATELEEKLQHVLNECRPTYSSKESRAVFDHNLKDALDSLPKLWEGLDINIKFDRIDKFEFTPECAVFDLLNISLYHGWLIDRQQSDLFQLIGQLSYNQLEEKTICYLNSDDQQEQQQGILARDFLHGHQISELGIQELRRKLMEGQLCVLFHNNHFSTLYKREGNIYLLVTDNGYLHTKCIWEKLTSVDGNNTFYDDRFRVYQERDWQTDAYESRASSASSKKGRAWSTAVAPSSSPPPQPPPSSSPPPSPPSSSSSSSSSSTSSSSSSLPPPPSSAPAQQERQQEQSQEKETPVASTFDDEALAEQLQIELILADLKSEEPLTSTSRTHDESFPSRRSDHSSTHSRVPPFDYRSHGDHVERRHDRYSHDDYMERRRDQEWSSPSTRSAWMSTDDTSDYRYRQRPHTHHNYYGHRTTDISGGYGSSYYYRDPVPPYSFDEVTPRSSSLCPHHSATCQSTHYSGSSGHSSGHTSRHPSEYPSEYDSGRTSRYPTGYDSGHTSRYPSEYTGRYPYSKY